MDKRVLITLGAIIVIAGAILIVRMLGDNCTIESISLSSNKEMVGKAITFDCVTESDQVTWDFGDQSKLEGAKATHTYSQPGKYKVFAKAGEDCQSSIEEIEIIPVPTIVTIMPAVSIPKIIRAMELTTFKDETDKANEWNWKVSESGEIGNSKSFSTSFKKAGSYTISLSVKGEYIKGDTAFQVLVSSPVVVQKKVEPRLYIPTPPAKKKEPAPTPDPIPVKETRSFMSDSEFKSLFLQVANDLAEEGNNSSTEWKEKIMSQFLSGGNTSIIVEDQNGNRKTMIISGFKIKQIGTTSPYKVLSVKNITRAANKSISGITISVANEQ